MVESVVINKAAEHVEPTLEAQAVAMGIDPSTVDNSATEQTADTKILGKFNTQDDLLKAYQELEKKMSSKDSKLPSDPEPETDDLPSDVEAKGDEDTETETDDETVEETLEAKGLDLDKFTKNYEETGALSDDDYKELESKGIPKTRVDEYIAGQEAIRELTRQAVFKEAGDEKSYWSMTDWASKVLNEAEIDNFNNAVNGPDRVAAGMAVKGLKARYEAEVGREPARTVGGTRQGTATSRYESVAQMQSDMADPRYAKDPAFRAKVEAKLSRSSIL